MTWKQLEARRELRLWITQVIAPTVAICTVAMNIPEVHDAVIAKCQDIKTAFRNVKEQIKTRLNEK